jgi:1-acyl-sn-glycerol-3-phosphate acyltransferase
VVRRRSEPWYTFAAVVLRPIMSATTRRVWTRTELLPPAGGLVVVPNHISHIDPLIVAHYLYDNGRPPRFLAKASLFEVVFVRRVLRGAGQIPVYRESRVAGDALRGAVAAVRAGECVVVYAEGTLTRDPHGWPMAGKTGAARIALETGCPVLPMGVWGPQELLPPYAHRPHLFPRKTMQVALGPPVDLSDLIDALPAGIPPPAQVLHQVTERIMDAVTEVVAQLRGQAPPGERLDPRDSELPTTGNAHVQYDLDPRQSPRKGHGSADGPG